MHWQVATSEVVCLCLSSIVCAYVSVCVERVRKHWRRGCHGVLITRPNVSQDLCVVLISSERYLCYVVSFSQWWSNKMPQNVCQYICLKSQKSEKSPGWGGCRVVMPIWCQSNSCHPCLGPLLLCVLDYFCCSAVKQGPNSQMILRQSYDIFRLRTIFWQLADSQNIYVTVLRTVLRQNLAITLRQILKISWDKFCELT